MTERVNRNLKPMIAQYTQGGPQSWDKEIQKLAFALRTSVNETTGETPAFLNLGRDPKLPIDILTDTTPTGPPLPPTTTAIVNYRSQLVQNLQYAHRVPYDHSEVAKAHQKRQYDKHTTNKTFHTGQLVWVAIAQGQLAGKWHAGKLNPRWQGPCRIPRQFAPSSFSVRRLTDGCDLGTANSERLKSYYEPLDSSSIPMITLPDNSSLTTSASIPPLMSLPVSSVPITDLRRSKRIIKSIKRDGMVNEILS
ncbi:unnamed protein product [Didymodactylos carnosus]|uniref:Uncharacterized protein n=1 Tax=Didymodactylos carnosus TaxID=1234261 RepID=A0A815K9V5_9BILA|nr:unnamed protein product [Didymodactylos carnosus]CAF4284591.1 unnamed protein product [Didymodactylos carnosus]